MMIGFTKKIASWFSAEESREETKPEEGLKEESEMVDTYVRMLQGYEKDQVPVRGETYEHFKGGRYTIIGVAMDTVFEEAVVIYQSVHDFRTYTRPLHEWISPKVMESGEQVERFRRVVRVGGVNEPVFRKSSIRTRQERARL